MNLDPEQIPDDPVLLRQLVIQLLKVVAEQARTTEQLKHQIAQLQRRSYGPRSEKIDGDQLRLFAEAGQAPGAASAVPEAVAADPSPRPRKRGHGRSQRPKDLPRVRIEHPIREQDRACGCGHTRQKIGEEISEQLEYTPSSFVILEHVRMKYACRSCEEGVVTSPAPAQPIEKGLPGPGLLAHVLTSKYGDHLPLHRLEGIFQRSKVTISRSTMCGWIDVVADLLSPLVREMARAIRTGVKIHVDDTTVPVLDRQRTKTRTGRLWVYIGDPAHPYIVYDYTPNRKRDGPVTFLDGYCGYLQGDAYSGYDGIYAGGSVIEVACWAHARRKFFEAQDTDRLRAQIALAYIGNLYEVERAAADLSVADRHARRQELSRPILEKLHLWIEEQREQALPKSPLGAAIGYATNQWSALERYLEHGVLDIDNNVAERALRCIAIGRKNWTFAGSDEGGRRAAVIYSLVSTCKRHRIDPFAYLRDVLVRVSTHPGSRIADLLPGQWLPHYRCPAQS